MYILKQFLKIDEKKQKAETGRLIRKLQQQFALAGVVQWVGRCPTKQKVTGSILIGAQIWAAGQAPGGGM